MRHCPVLAGSASIVLGWMPAQWMAKGLESEGKEASLPGHNPALGIASSLGILGLEGAWLLGGLRHVPRTSALCGFVPPTCLGVSIYMKEACGKAQGAVSVLPVG